MSAEVIKRCPQQPAATHNEELATDSSPAPKRFSLTSNRTVLPLGDAPPSVTDDASAITNYHPLPADQSTTTPAPFT